MSTSKSVLVFSHGECYSNADKILMHGESVFAIYVEGF